MAFNRIGFIAASALAICAGTKLALDGRKTAVSKKEKRDLIAGILLSKYNNIYTHEHPSSRMARQYRKDHPNGGWGVTMSTFLNSKEAPISDFSVWTEMYERLWNEINQDINGKSFWTGRDQATLTRDLLTEAIERLKSGEFGVVQVASYSDETSSKIELCQVTYVAENGNFATAYYTNV